MRAVALPLVALAILVATGVASSSHLWKRHVLGVAFLIYYLVVVVYGIHRANLTADELFEGDPSPEERLRRAARAFQFHFACWVTGAVTLAAAFFTAMMKSRWDMPVPWPYAQILSGMLWSVLSAAILQLLALYRRVKYGEGRSPSAYAARGFLLYGVAVVLFPTYFFLYAGHGRHVTIPWLIYFTLPTNILMFLLLVRMFRKVRTFLGDQQELLFGKHAQKRARQLGRAFAAVMLLAIVIGFDYGRNFTSLWVFAAKSDSPAMFRMLRGLGANQKRTDEYGFTPLHWAIQEDSRDFAAYALAQGADREALNRFEQTPLMLAVLLDRVDIVKQLIAAGADVSHGAYRGQTPLMLAARDGRLEILKLLLAKKAKVNPRDDAGESALSYAVTSGHAQVVSILLESGAQTNIETSRFSPSGTKRSLLRAAMEAGHTQTVEVLKKAGVR